MDSINVSLSEDGEARFPQKDNVGMVEILNNNRVMLTLNKNALIGLGHQLIRLAHMEYKNGYHVHVDPCEKGNLPQYMGFYSHPDSVELIISCSDYDAIDNYIK